MAFNNFLSKVTMPIERLLGVTSLGASTTRSLQTLGRQYNRTRNF
jgi:polysaccharide biosynthesis/export protein